MRSLYRLLITLLIAALGLSASSAIAQPGGPVLQRAENQSAPVPHYNSFGHLRADDTTTAPHRSVYAPTPQTPTIDAQVPTAPTPSAPLYENRYQRPAPTPTADYSSAIPRSVSREAAKMSLDIPPSDSVITVARTERESEQSENGSNVVRASATISENTANGGEIQPCVAIQHENAPSNPPTDHRAPTSGRTPTGLPLSSANTTKSNDAPQGSTKPFSLDNATADTPIPFVTSDKAKSTDDFNAENSLLGSTATVITSLAIVIGAFLMVMRLLRRTGPKSLFALPEEAFESLGRAPLSGAAGRQNVHLIRLGTKLILLSVTPDGATPLVEIDDPAEVDHICGLCRRDKDGSSTDSFQDVMRQLTSRKSADAPAPQTAQVTRQQPTEQEPDVSEEAIRLQRLRETSRQGERIGNYTIDSYQAATGMAARGEGA